MKYLHIFVLLFLIGCTTQTQPTTPETPALSNANTTPVLDTSKHSVPLEEIYFDTFRSYDRAVSLTRADDALITRLRDAIPPLHNPKYESADYSFFSQNDLILGYTNDAGAWAFPIKILNYHEIVNDTYGDKEVLISFCPLCGSGIVYDRIIGGKTLTFGNTSALYENDMVMLDYETGSYWWQVAGSAIVGELTHTQLTTLPSQMMTLGEWRTRYPETKILSADTGFDRPYERNGFAGYEEGLNNGRFAFPINQDALDTRLPFGERVLTVTINEMSKAYVINAHSGEAINDTVGGEDIVVVVSNDGVGTAVFARPDNHEFILRGNQLVANGTGWLLTGESKTADKLTPLPSKTTFWFAASGAQPDLEIYSNPQ